MIRRPRVRFDGDRGAVMPIVAISMVVLLGSAALTVDLGNGWRTRRALIPATDAGALAAAQDKVNGANDVTACNTAESYVLLNETNTDTPISCSHIPINANQGAVTVTATHNVDVWFYPVLGGTDYTVEATSTAVYGPPATVTGLRPIGLCLDSHPDLADAVNNPPTPPATETVVTVTYGKSQPTACGSSIPGNWGIIDFAESNNGQPTINGWIRDGYPDPVYFDPHTVTSCPNGELHCYDGNPGSINNSYSSALNELKNSGIYFTLPIFNHAEGHGSHAQFHLAAVVRVRLIDFKVTGNQANRSLTLGVLPGLITGTCCGPGGGASGNRVVAICGVDPGEYTACNP